MVRHALRNCPDECIEAIIQASTRARLLHVFLCTNATRTQCGDLLGIMLHTGAKEEAGKEGKAAKRREGWGREGKGWGRVRVRRHLHRVPARARNRMPRADAVCAYTVQVHGAVFHGK